MNQNLNPATTFLHCAGLLYIENRKLLLAYSSNKQCYYLPGGKISDNESPVDALCREIFEELAVTIGADELQFYTHITAPAYGEMPGTIMEQDCFLLQKKITPAASAEVMVLDYFSLEEYKAQPQQAPGAVMILEQLKATGYID